MSITHDNKSLDSNILRRQLLSYRRFLDDAETKSKVDLLLNLPDEELLMAKFIHERGTTKARDIEGYIHASRSTVLKYCRLLESKRIVSREEIKPENSSINPAYIFSILDEKIKEIFAALETQELEAMDQDIKSFSENGSGEARLPVAENAASSDELALITQKISQLPSIAKQILGLIGSSGTTAKAASEKIGCASTSTNKYLKEFFDAGWVTRNKDDTRNGEYAYYLTDELSKILNVSPDKVQQQISEEIFMESVNIPQQSTYQPQNLSFASRLKQWISLNHQIKEIEKDLIAREGSDAEELLADLRQKAL